MEYAVSFEMPSILNIFFLDFSPFITEILLLAIFNVSENNRIHSAFALPSTGGEFKYAFKPVSVLTIMLFDDFG